MKMNFFILKICAFLSVFLILFYIFYNSVISEVPKVSTVHHFLRRVSDNFLPPNNCTHTVNIVYTSSNLIIKQHGNFWILFNFVSATTSFEYNETVTLSVPSDFRFLDNLIPLVEHWDGPISVSLHTPGDDFQTALDTIAYLRNCENTLIRALVTFHIFLENQHFPSGFTSLENSYKDSFDCSKDPPYKKYQTGEEQTYKKKNNLLFPINLARNIAREAAQTYFVFPSDIELYPSKQFTSKFIAMMKRTKIPVNEKNIYVLPVFEVLKDVKVPNSKTELVEMIKNSTAFSFHLKLCSFCHKIPNYDEWIKIPESGELKSTYAAKRNGHQSMWEPFYVGTHNEPVFDERLTWEGQSDKMTQAYSLCLLDYNFQILNDAFLVHKPGIKLKHSQDTEYSKETKATSKLLPTIKKELSILYGKNDKC